MTMAEYIDKNATVGILEAMSRSADCECIKKRLEKAAKRVSAIPAADVAQVVHGRWEYTPQTFNTLGQIRCPFCAWWSLDQSIDGIYKYCPNCGAKMDGGDNDATD